MTRGIDNLKKARGESTTNVNSLRMKFGQETQEPTAQAFGPAQPETQITAL